MDEVPMLRKHRFTHYRTEILMAVVALITILAIWLVPGQQDKTSPALPQLTTPAPPMEPEATLPAPMEKPLAETLSGDRARAIISSLRADGKNPDPAEVYANAQRLQDEGHPEDAYLLYRYAANHGDSRAALVLGSQADPAYHNSDNTILPEPEPEQAIKWYRLASKEGNAEASTRLEALHALLERESAAGDARANRLLLQWP